jgi:transposase-like protein
VGGIRIVDARTAGEIALQIDCSPTWVKENRQSTKCQKKATSDNLLTNDSEPEEQQVKGKDGRSRPAKMPRKRRTNADKQRAVKAALSHPKADKLSLREIADHVGVDPKTVSNWKEKVFESKAIIGNSHDAMTNEKPKTRTVTRKGCEPYEMKLPAKKTKPVETFSFYKFGGFDQA